MWAGWIGIIKWRSYFVYMLGYILVTQGSVVAVLWQIGMYCAALGSERYLLWLACQHWLWLSVQIKHLSRAKKNSEKHYKTLKHKKLATCSFLWLEIICPKDTLKNSVTAHSLGLLHRHFAEIFYSIRHVNEYPTMHYFGSPGRTQSMIAFISFWLSISGNSRE